MSSALLLVALLCAAPAPPGPQDGGQDWHYQPPPPAEGEGDPPPFNSQPGTGPLLPFEADRWEWWFDFNQEGLLELRVALAEAAPAPGQRPWSPVDDQARTDVVLPELLGALKLPHRDLRATAALALGRLRSPAALPALGQALEDRDLFVRRHALLGLGMSEQPGAVELLAGVLEDPREPFSLRSVAAVALGLNRQPEALALLRSRLTSRRLATTSNPLRGVLIYAAGVSGDEGLGMQLEQLASEPPVGQDTSLRSLTAVALGQIGAPSALPLLLEWIDDSHNQLRHAAAAGLGGLAGHLDAAQVARLCELEGSEGDFATATQLRRALGLSGRDEAAACLRDRMRRGSTLVQTDLALGLGLQGRAEHLAPLAERLSDTYETSARAVTLLALGLLRDGSAREWLEADLDRNQDPALRAWHDLALGLLPAAGPRALQRLLGDASTSHDPEVVRLAILALGLQGCRNELDVLAGGLADPLLGSMDRAARIYALGFVGDRVTLDLILAQVRNAEQPAYVRRYALGALAEIADPRDLPPAARLSRCVDLHVDRDPMAGLFRVL